jgi:hypothetical protein
MTQVNEQVEEHRSAVGTPHRPKLRWIGGGLASVIAGAITLWYGHPELQQDVCTNDLVRSHGGIINGRCKAEYRVVSLAEATHLMDAFFRQVGGAEKNKGRDMLTPVLREQITDDRFQRDWPAHLVGVERTRELIAEKNNQFVVEYRRFEVPDTTPVRPWASKGPVIRLRQVLRLQGSDNGPLIAEFVGTRKIVPIAGEAKVREYAWAELTVRTKAFDRPSKDASPTRMSDLRPGKGLRVLCAWTAGNGGRWYRTYGGWLDAGEAKLEQVPSEGVLDCVADG